MPWRENMTMQEITFGFTVLCIAVFIALAVHEATGRRIVGLWLLCTVIAASFAWLALTDIAAWLGDPSLATGHWRAFVHRGSIGTAAALVLAYNVLVWRRGAKPKGF